MTADSATIPVSVLWTGGFDSTARILEHLRDGREVQPIYMAHSTGWEKSQRETAARARIRAALSAGALRPDRVWDLEQLQSGFGGAPLWRVCVELCDALQLSHQYAALRFCREVTGTIDLIECCVVMYDEVWERLIHPTRPAAVETFFRGFPMPLLDKSKRTLWLAAPPAHQAVLALTFSCEETDHDGRTCRERSLAPEKRCTGCKRRIEELPT